MKSLQVICTRDSTKVLKASLCLLSGEMRHNFLFVNCNVADCFCNFCKKDTIGQGYRESLYNTDHIAYMPTALGSKMDKLIAELELLSSDCSAAKENSDLFTPEKCRRHVDLCKGTVLSESTDVFGHNFKQTNIFLP